jgi:hypothetical protein
MDDDLDPETLAALGEAEEQALAVAPPPPPRPSSTGSLGFSLPAHRTQGQPLPRPVSANPFAVCNIKGFNSLSFFFVNGVLYCAETVLGLYDKVDTCNSCPSGWLCKQARSANAKEFSTAV